MRYGLTILGCLFLKFAISSISLAQTKNWDHAVIGVIASSQKSAGLALVKDKSTGKTQFYRPGDKIQADLELARIEQRYVHLKWQGAHYRLRVGDDTPEQIQNRQPTKVPAELITDLSQAEGIERQGDVLTVTGALKTALIEDNLGKILMQAAAVPYTRDGELLGFKLLAIDQGSIFDMAGFRNGDVVTHINDQPIRNAALAIRALNSLKKASEARFSYLRENKSRELLVRIN
jgi:type II secretory pathway component PulC